MSPMKNIHKHLTTEELATYAQLLQENRVEQAEQEIIDHIANCDQCSSEAIELSFVLDEVSEIKQIRKTKSRSLNYLYWGLAASILIAVFVWLSPAIWQDNSIEQSAQKEEISVEKDTLNALKKSIEIVLPKGISNNKGIVKPKLQKELLAYQTNKDLELLYEDFKGNMRGEEVVITTKSEININFGKPILVQWKNTESLPLTIELFDHKGSNILSEETNTSSFNIEQKLKPALYYWKLYNEEFDLLFCGKIVVR